MKNSKFFIIGLIGSVMISLLGLVSCAKNTKPTPTMEKDGGLTITMEVAVPDILDALSGHNSSVKFKEAIAAARQQQRQGNSDDFLTLFFDEYEKDGGQLVPLFASVMRDKIDLDMSNGQVKEILRDEVEAAIENSFDVLRTRIDRFGVAQPVIQRFSNNRIGIALPGVYDGQRIAKLLQSDGNLEFWETYNFDEIFDAFTQIDAKLADEGESLFRLFISQGMPGSPIAGEAKYIDTAKIKAILSSPMAKAILPRDARFFWEVKSLDDRGMYFRLISLKSQRGGGPSLQGDCITDARADGNGYNGRAEVLMIMNDTGARKWEKMTMENIGRSIAMVLDSYVYSYPVVQDRISGGRSQISGNFTMEEATDLANIFISGQLPAPVRIISMEEVEPSK